MCYGHMFQVYDEKMFERIEEEEDIKLNMYCSFNL
jgi:hypothetical protein